MDGFYNKCKNCGKMKLMGFRCNACLYTDPDESHSPTCMCITCIPTPKDEPDATDPAEAVSGKDLTEWDDLGEAG